MGRMVQPEDTNHPINNSNKLKQEIDDPSLPQNNTKNDDNITVIEPQTSSPQKSSPPVDKDLSYDNDNSMEESQDKNTMSENISDVSTAHDGIVKTDDNDDVIDSQVAPPNIIASTVNDDVLNKDGSKPEDTNLP